MLQLNLYQHFITLIDYFADDNSYRDPAKKQHARIFVGSLLMLILCGLLTLIGTAINPASPDSHTYIGVILICLLIGIFSIFLMLIKATANIVVIAQVFSTVLYVIFTGTLFVSGGPWASSTQLLFLIPLSMFFIAGTRYGLFWTGFILLSQLIIYAMHWNGYIFIQTMSEDVRIEQSLIHWLLSLFCIMAIAWVYERANQRLQSQRLKNEVDNRFLSEHDMLTGLSNRQSLQQQLKQSIKQADKQHSAFSLYLIDIKQFYKVNQRLGYAVGDSVLQQFSQHINGAIEQNLIARMSGNQFAIISQTYISTSHSNEQALRLLKAANAAISIDHEIVSLTVAIGACEYPTNANDLDSILENSEKALREAKLSPQCIANA